MLVYLYLFFQDSSAKHWILPIIQGYFEVERCSVENLEGLAYDTLKIDEGEDSDSDEEDGFIEAVKDFKTGENLKEDEYDIVLISRRSRYRAGKIISNVQSYKYTTVL